MIYSYRTFDMLRVIEITDALAKLQLNPESGYLSYDEDTRYFLATLNEGYRWVRTENGLAIFEKEMIQIH